MSKRTEDLAFKYNINASVDGLSLFVSEVYNDGFGAGNKAREASNNTSSLRDHFAGLAMQGYLSGYYSGGDIYETIADVSYELADAMLKARGVGDE